MKTGLSGRFIFGKKEGEKKEKLNVQNASPYNRRTQDTAGGKKKKKRVFQHISRNLKLVISWPDSKKRERRVIFVKMNTSLSCLVTL